MSSLLGLFQKEKRAYPPQWVADALGAGPVASGVTVSEETALKYVAFYAAVDLISRGVAQLPMILYTRQADGGRKRVTDHYLYELLHTRPNPEQTAYSYYHYMQSCALIWGNAYAEIERETSGRVKARWPIAPSTVSPLRTSAGALAYEVTEGPNKKKTIPAENMEHVHTLGDGLVGFSPVRQFREAIGLGIAAEKYGAAFFGNDARPGGILEHPKLLGPEAIKNLRASWTDLHAGPGNASKPAILEEGMQWKSIGMPHDDAQFIETRQFQVVDVCRIFHIPPHKLQDLVRATFSNIEEQSVEWVQDCLGPWLVNWEQELNWKLIALSEPSVRHKLYCEFLVEGMLRGDAEGRSKFYAQMFNIGAMSQNEIRQRENMNPVKGGEKYFVPMNMVPVDQAGKPPEPPQAPPDKKPNEPDEDKPDAEAAHRKLLAEICARIVHKEINAMRKAAKRWETFEANVDGFYAGHKEHIREVLQSAIWAYAATVGLNMFAYPKSFARDCVQRSHAMLWGVPEKAAMAKLEEMERDNPIWMVNKIIGDMRNAAAETK